MNAVNTVLFPNLGIEVTLHKTAFSIFGLEIQWYALIITAGFLCAFFYALKNSRKFGLTFNDFFDPVFWGTIFGIIGARTYFVVFHFDLYRDNLKEVFNIRSGGLAIYGAVIGAVLAGFVVMRIKKLPFLPLTDMCMVGFLIGQAFGRWGNFVNVEAYGAQTSADYLLGMTSASINREMGAAVGETILVHPCFFYESVWCLLCAIGLFFYLKHRKFDGEITLLYMFLYGLERMVVEGLRTDSLYIPNTQIRVSQMLSFVLVLIAGALLTVFYLRIAKQRKEHPDYMKMYVHSDLAAERIAKDDAEMKQESEARKAFWAKLFGKSEQSGKAENPEQTEQPDKQKLAETPDHTPSVQQVEFTDPMQDAVSITSSSEKRTDHPTDSCQNKTDSADD